MAHATTTAPTQVLRHHQVTTLKDLFHSIQGLETGTRTAEGQQLIQRRLGSVVAKDIIDFWDDEWTV